MSASSSDRSDVGAPTAAETSPATRTATCPYIEGSELLAAIYRYARALESLGIARGDLVAIYAPNRSCPWTGSRSPSRASRTAR